MRIFCTLVAVLMILVVSSCSQKMSFAVSPVVPGASGKAKIKKDDNKNYNITVDVLNLADPKNLTPPRNIYLVWMEGDGNNARKLGQISTATGFFSQTRKGSLSATSITKPTRIFITAEDDAEVRYPGMQVLSTE